VLVLVLGGDGGDGGDDGDGGAAIGVGQHTIAPLAYAPNCTTFL